MCKCNSLLPTVHTAVRRSATTHFIAGRMKTMFLTTFRFDLSEKKNKKKLIFYSIFFLYHCELISLFYNIFNDKKFHVESFLTFESKIPLPFLKIHEREIKEYIFFPYFTIRLEEFPKIFLNVNTLRIFKY